MFGGKQGGPIIPQAEDLVVKVYNLIGKVRAKGFLCHVLFGILEKTKV